MKLEELEHVLAVAAELARTAELVVIGSQAILGSAEQPPEEMLLSMEADVYSTGDPEHADDIDGVIGEGSQFHVTFGYYAHTVGERTAKLPAGWRGRAVTRQIPPRPGSRRPPVSAIFPQAEDLLLSKLAAGRDRDIEYVRVALDGGVGDPEVMRGRVDDLPGPEKLRAHVRGLLDALTGR